MRHVLFTHPGKHGDALWSMATIKTYAELIGRDVELVVSPYLTPLIPLLYKQPYLSNVSTGLAWEVEFSAPVRPWEAPGILRDDDVEVIHLGMREWPTPTLGEYYPRLLQQEYGLTVQPNWAEPWIDVGPVDRRQEAVVSFSDEYAESKAGLVMALRAASPLPIRLLVRRGSRIQTDFGLEREVSVEVCDMQRLAERLASARVAVVCNSVAHPLGVAVGANLVVYEPQPMRHNPVFKAPPSCQNVRYSDSVNSFELIPHFLEALKK